MSKPVRKKASKKKKECQKRADDPRKPVNEPKSKCMCREPLYMKFGPPKEIPVKTNIGFNETLARINDPCKKTPEEILRSILKLSTTPPHSRSPYVESSYISASGRRLSKQESQGEIQGRHYGKSHSSIYGLTFSEPLRIYNFGERGSGTRTKGPPQDFQTLRSHHLENHTLFEDPEFPANEFALFYNGEADNEYEWKRPSEIVDDPKFFVDGFSRSDVQQGKLGDCWLTAATTNLTLHHHLFVRVVPEDQCFGQHYAGIFHFRFWHYGRWIDVVTDDRLPTYNGKLVYFHSSEVTEFWSALLEKAYAKLQGCFEALKGGSTCEGMVDVTGGVVELYNIKKQPVKDMFKILLKASERSSLMGASMEQDAVTLYARTPEGLLRGHAYSITAIKELELLSASRQDIKIINLVRLRNPWGNQPEWTGAWSDDSEEWKSIPYEIKEDMSLKFESDGEFWMSFEDFIENFDRLEVCNMNPDSLLESELSSSDKKKWQMSVFEGEWVAGVTAGGCRNFMETFWLNPQYRITLEEIDDDDEDKKCTVIVALMQKHSRRRKKVGQNVFNIGYVIYQLHDPEKFPKPLDYNFFKYNHTVGKSPTYINMREVTYRFKFPPGSYCIVPSTFNPGEESEFLIRVFSEHPNNMIENDQNVSLIEDSSLPAIKEEEWEKLEDENLESKAIEMFLDTYDEDEEIGWLQLKEILDETMTSYLLEEFSKDTCRSMIAMVDYDRSGKLCLEEFRDLCVGMLRWKKVFNAFDTTKAGSLSGNELRQAFLGAGYNLNARILNLLMHRYGNEEQKVAFDDFVTCAIKLKTMIDLFDTRKNEYDMICLGLEEWLECALYS